ncbi:MAG: PfkB family carbohydrate kinase [Armatimonadota bacterium]|nr:PfkB family carbohydrate kinase [Armatimonadota bacterium]MDR7493790.1 PfkB family carbohydrate kinase [Armatimonadota bacterium]MDR7505786.1 PfkB family carbohydrate kinase [Armatimonadota bacterium]MDR7546188.1 PfkB family carbohydrate kinase [Armatimonadota bacterium]MDR7559578.1 PfkB family carbohydrate kinase [Armatimonadota bacterium]
MSADIDVAFVGHFARDRLVVGGAAEAASGGGVYYGAMAARRLGYTVAVVTKLHPDDFPFLEEMRREGIVVHASPAPQTTGIENIYPDPSTDRRLCHPLGFAGPFTAAEIPPLEARVTIITPLMAGEVSAETVRLLAARGSVGLDVQGFARVREGDVLVTRDWPGKERDLAAVTYLKADDAEAEVLTGRTDLREAARALADLGPREVLLTHAGGVLAFAGGTFYEGRFTPRAVRGRTGRGDTTFAAYVAARTHADPEYACRLAAAVVSLKLEHPGPYRFTRAEAERRMAG